MADSHLAQTALAHFGLEAHAAASCGEAGVWIALPPPRFLYALSGDGEDEAFAVAAASALGFALPRAPNTTAGEAKLTALWLGPTEWLLAGLDDEGPLAAALSGLHHALLEVSDARFVFRLGGPRARDLLAQGTGLDLDRLASGACAQSTMALADMLLHRLPDDADGDPVFELYVGRSFADYLWRWLEAAAREYGLALLSADLSLP